MTLKREDPVFAMRLFGNAERQFQLIQCNADGTWVELAVGHGATDDDAVSYTLFALADNAPAVEAVLQFLQVIHRPPPKADA